MRTSPSNPRRRGMALLLVVAVMAMAAVLGYAMLSVNTVQAQLATNLGSAADAEYVANSGINVSAYYLQTPSATPGNWSGTAGDKLNAAGIALNDGSTASFDCTAISGAGRNNYTIQSTGRSVAGSNYTHTSAANITVTRATIPGAGIFGGNITVPNRTTFSDGGVSGAIAVQANGTVTAATGSAITGTIKRAPLVATAYVAPTAATVNYYGVGMAGGNYLAYDGVTLGTPQQISLASIKTASIPAVAATNPGAVYYHTGSLTISGTCAITGTLIVRGGALTISANTTITPKTGFPALVCEQGVTISGASRTFTANGVVFIGGNYTWTGTNTSSKFLVNGALVMPSGSTIQTTNNGTFTVTYASAKANVPDLTTFDQPGLSLKINSWAQ